MRLTTRTNLAMRTLMFCAVNNGKIVRKADVAKACNASQNHLGLVINLLGQAGYIETCRGRHGGIRLAKPADEISVGEVCRTFEAEVPFAECFEKGANTCPLTDTCLLKGILCEALEAFYSALDRHTVAELTTGNRNLAGLLRLPDAA